MKIPHRQRMGDRNAPKTRRMMGRTGRLGGFPGDFPAGDWRGGPCAQCARHLCATLRYLFANAASFCSRRGTPRRYKDPHLIVASCYWSQPIGWKDFRIHFAHPYARLFAGSASYLRPTNELPPSLHVRVSP